MNEEFENFNDQDEEWLTELEIRATDLENDLFDWREAHARELTDTSYGRDGMPAAIQGRPDRGCCEPSRDRTPSLGTAAPPAWAAAGRGTASRHRGRGPEPDELT